MVARNFSVQEIPYSRLLQVPDDDRDFITLEELKPAIDQQNIHQQQQQQPYHHQQHQQQQHQPTYYELTNISEASCSSYHQHPSTKTIMELQPVDSSHSSSSRKRKISCHETPSDLEEENSEDVKSVKTSEENKKQNHSEIEKRRRDKMNTYITELSAMVPMCHAMSRKLDKLTVLRMAVQHLKTIRGAVHSYTEGHYKPSFLSDQELKHLILQAADGFLFVVGCDRGRILFVSESVSKVLNFAQGDLLGQSLFDILHPKDVAKVKEQLSSSDLNPRERLIDAKTMLPVKTDVPQGASRFCPGARRSFFCRMKCQMSSQVKEEADTTTGVHRRKKQPNSEKKYNVIQCTGYLKSWAPAKIGLEDQETDDGDNESCNLSCLVAVGRILPHISTVTAVTSPSSAAPSTTTATQNRPINVRPVQFISRHTLDGKFLFIDQRATLVLGFLPQELLGSSMYEYYHHDDISSIAECHKLALQNTDRVTTKIYRFRSKDGGFVRLQTEWKSFKNPWTKEIEYLIAKNTLVLTDFRTVESSAGRLDGLSDNFEFFTQNNEKDIQRIIDTHVEASKIGRQIAEQVMDSQRRLESSESSPDPEPEPCFAMSTTTNQISTSAQSDPTQLMHDFTQQPHQPYDVTNNVALSSVANVPGDSTEGIMEMMEDAVREVPINNGPPTDGNDEAAMAVIMSLLEADAGLGGPVDFSGLPWPLP